MSGHVRVGGVWKKSTPSVKVSGAWKNTISGWVRVSGVWKQWFFAAVYDTFTRTTSGTLGTANTGQVWANLRGVWFANGSAAQSDTSASSYPVAYVNMGEPDVTVSLSVTNGVGPAFWITDSNNWWASYAYSQTSTGCGGGPTGWSPSVPTCTCGSVQSQSVSDCSGGPTAWSQSVPTCSCGSVESRTVIVPGYYSTEPGACDPPSTSVSCTNCGGCPSGYVCCSYPSTSYQEYRCSASPGTSTQYRCSDSPTTTTTRALRIISSVAGTVSTISPDTSLPSDPAAIKVITSGTSITATAYSDTGMATLIGTNSKTPSSPTRGTSVGIVKAPSSLSQGSTGDTFSATV